MANVSGASLNGIYNRLHDAPEYHPLSANTFADWSLEAGDIVTVTRDGKSYASPAMNNTTVWRKKQQVTVNATGKEQRDTVATMSKRKFRGGGASLRATQKAFDQIITSYNEMTAGLVLASSTAHLYVDNMYTQMKSGLYLTASTAHLYVDNKYSQMTAGLNLTSSTAKLYVDNKYSQMTAGLNLTSSTAKLYVDNKYSQMTAGLNLTSSTAKLYVDNKYSQMSAGLDLTSSTAKLYVDNKYAQMTSGLVLSESSAKLYAQNRTTRAYIMARINADGEGEALIEADKVKITGTTKLNDVMTITNNAVGFNKPAIFSDDVSINSTGDLNVYTINLKGSSDISLSKSEMEKAIKEASVSGNTLTLTQFNGDTVTFSKATSLSGEWSSGHLEVTASPQNEKYNQYIISGDNEDVSEDENIWYVPILAKDNPYSQSSVRTGHRVYVNATARYNAGKTQGYKNAANAMGWPVTISGATTKSTVDITYPTTGGGTSTRTLKLTKDSGGAYVQLGSSLILRIDI